VFQNLSALEKDVLSESIVEKTRARQVEVSRAISTADVDATSRSLSEARQATQAAAAQAAQIRAQEVARDQEQRRVQAVAEENFIKAVGQTTQASVKLAAELESSPDAVSREDAIAREVEKFPVVPEGGITTGGLTAAVKSAAPARTRNSMDVISSDLLEFEDYYNEYGFNIGEFV